MASVNLTNSSAAAATSEGFNGLRLLMIKGLLHMQAELVNLRERLMTLKEKSGKSYAEMMMQCWVFELKNPTLDSNMRKR